KLLLWNSRFVRRKAARLCRRAAPTHHHEDASDEQDCADNTDVKTQVQDARTEERGKMLHDSEDDQKNAKDNEDPGHKIVPSRVECLTLRSVAHDQRTMAVNHCGAIQTIQTIQTI